MGVLGTIGGYIAGGPAGALFGSGKVPMPWDWGDESESAKQQREQMAAQGQRASDFADQGQLGYAAASEEARRSRQFLQDQAMGKNSISAEQLRQGLQQQQAQMQSMAQGGPASSAPMMARTAMIGAGRASSAMAGNAAMAGIAERNAAQKAWADAILGARGQDANVALGSRQNAIGGFGGVKPEGSFLDKWGNAISTGAGMAAGA